MYKKIAFFFFMSLSVQSLLYGQTLLDKEIQLKNNKASIKEILDEIGTHGGFSFTYSNEVDIDRKVTPQGNLKTVREWLDQLFGRDKVEYVIHDNKIILRPLTKSGLKRDNIILHGHVTDSLTGEVLIGATLYIKTLAVGVASNAYGFFSLTIPKGLPTGRQGVHQIGISFIGYKTKYVEMDFTADQVLDVQLTPVTQELNEVSVIAAEADVNVNVAAPDMGMHKLSAETLKKIPALAGEVDVLRALQLLPGVKNSGEVSSNFSVRGGGLDQNMILLDEAPVYNPSHVIGIFSTFNTDAINDVQLYKGAIPSEYGGRLSSVLDVRMKDGNAKKFSATGGIGTLSSRLTLEGPIIKDRSTFQFSGRYTYGDAITQTAKYFRQNHFRFYFYDLNFKLSHTFNSKNKLFLSAFAGEDVNRLGNQGDVKWSNMTSTLRWNHIFHDRLFSNTTLLYSKYHYNISSGFVYVNPFAWDSGIEDVALKDDFTFFANHSNTVKFGFSSTYHSINPGKASSVTQGGIQLPTANALEHAVYANNEQELSSRWLLHYGVRYSLFQNLGKNTNYVYSPDHAIVDSVQHDGNGVYHAEGGLEPRVAARYLLNETSSIKTSYTRTYQYLQLLSNSSLGLSPLDTWYPSGPNVKPQKADQVSVGYFKNFTKHALETSVEVYYKWLYNQVDFANHAQLLFNPHIEQELRIGKGYGYGVEFLVNKKSGDLTGWVGYTYSRAKKLIPEISDHAFNANYDQPHSFSVVANYSFNPRFQLSGNWVYSTGRPITLPIESFGYKDYPVPVYTERNSIRLPDYHRLDLSLTIQSRPKKDKRFNHNWVISAFNVYARKNPLLIFTSPPFSDFKSVRGNDAYSVAVLPFIPSVTYNFKF